jgi:uncharacterized cupin superfamily protein
LAISPPWRFGTRTPKFNEDCGLPLARQGNRSCAGRIRKRLGDAAGLDQFGVNLTTLKPGASSAQRHWHTAEDELVYVLTGEVVLCEDGGETVLRAGDAAGFKADAANGHCPANRSGEDAVYYPKSVS